MQKLTATAVKQAKPKSKAYKLSDGGSLYLLVNSQGKYWRYGYRFADKRKTLATSVYPHVSLKVARETHQNAREGLASGILVLPLIAGARHRSLVRLLVALQ